MLDTRLVGHQKNNRVNAAHTHTGYIQLIGWNGHDGQRAVTSRLGFLDRTHAHYIISCIYKSASGPFDPINRAKWIGPRRRPIRRSWLPAFYFLQILGVVCSSFMACVRLITSIPSALRNLNQSFGGLFFCAMYKSSFKRLVSGGNTNDGRNDVAICVTSSSE